jgi:hypothetical protein
MEARSRVPIIRRRDKVRTVALKKNTVIPEQEGTHFHAGGSIAGTAPARGPFNNCRRWVPAGVYAWAALRADPGAGMIK